MADVFRLIQCPSCLQRLNKPKELYCKHVICAKCLEVILQNHSKQRPSKCPKCQTPFEEYLIEKYDYLPQSHQITKLLTRLEDIDLCFKCKDFTDIQKCDECKQTFCENCINDHQHKKSTVSSPTILNKSNLNDFTSAEIAIIESVKEILTEKEYIDFIAVTRMYLKNPIKNSKEGYRPSTIAQSTTTISKNFNFKEFLNTEVPYDWMRHEHVTQENILLSPQRAKNLLRLDFVPRAYQLRMARHGLNKTNSVVCLQTGAGKTWVAGIVVKFLYILTKQSSNIGNNNNYLKKSSNSSRFKCVFLVPIKALIEQQCIAFKKIFPDQSDKILKQIDKEAAVRFNQLYDQFDIFFFTYQKFNNYIEANHIKFNMFDLIVIDECHHCYSDHPVMDMMRRYHQLKVQGDYVPQIMGLTASVGTNKGNGFEHLVQLCANLDSLYVCAIENDRELEELRKSTNTPLADTIIPVAIDLTDPYAACLKEEVMTRICNRLNYETSQFGTQMFENYLMTKYQNAVKRNDRMENTGCDYLLKFNRFLQNYNDLPFQQCYKWLEDELHRPVLVNYEQFELECRRYWENFRRFVENHRSDQPYVKNKLKKLTDLILQLHESESKGLILVRTKFHTVALEIFLSEHPDLIARNIRPGRLTGQGSLEDMYMPANIQMASLNQFRSGVKNLLVATDVAQEGLDVAECSYVIRYEFVSNEIGTVQSRGRARALQSKCFLITETQSLNQRRELENRSKEIDMKRALEELKEKGVHEFQKLVVLKQAELIEQIHKNGGVNRQPLEPTTHSEVYSVRCRYCNTYLCQSSALRKQGTTYVCIDPQFIKEKITPMSDDKKFYCSNPSCGKELGPIILFTVSMPGYALTITALKFVDRHGDSHTYKKWSMFPSHVQSL
ncbi:unnamed protein product [Didymodactylos carnosus]|uniref:RNA helicase n=1 Tax=Didymodactylos carnosus TaxID=1234261 RepID=A0A813S8P9_9BILA|nr:unnamed protein product [Didymodactylos carnosus]CAF0792787.1 unnamed protein product [Didymodactylos carnosus]CAF3564364.1 unnamed protein product [Didymodactylos carnosus]CAF3577137.1 unnamed protein product [Didymodactylos carnosus]